MVRLVFVAKHHDLPSIMRRSVWLSVRLILPLGTGSTGRPVRHLEHDVLADTPRHKVGPSSRTKIEGDRS